MSAGTRPIRIAVLVSGRGRGTNFQAILEGCRSGQIYGEVSLLVSTTPNTPAMARALSGGVPALFLSPQHATPEPPPPCAHGRPGDTEADFDQSLLNLLEEHRIDLVCLAGFMRKVGPMVLARYQNRIMNVHPSLVPAFAGPGMFGLHVHQSVLEYGVKVSGCTVQFINEDYDAGPVIVQRAVPVAEDDTPESLAARVLEQEHAGYIEAIQLFAQGRLQVEGRRVRVLKEAKG